MLHTLESSLKNKDKEIQSLIDRLEENNQEIQFLKASVAEMQQQIRRQNLYMAEREQILQALNTRLLEIMNSTAWSIVQWMWRVRLFLAPHGSRRESFGRSLIGVLKGNSITPDQSSSHGQESRDLDLLRSSDLFDKEFYLNGNPDIAESSIDPMLHFLRYGGFEGRDPSPNFSTNWYLDTYEDVKKAGINPLVHYLTTGMLEGRTTKSQVNRDETLSDKDWIKAEFFHVYGKEIDLIHPLSFSEKNLVYNLVYRERDLSSYVDKYAVRDYVAKTIGEQYLIPLCGCYETVNEISIDALPDRFVMKATHGSGWNIICKDKHTFNWDVERIKIDEWMRTNFYWRYRECLYKNIHPRIMIEQLILDENNGIPNDYKIFCFDGNPKFVQIIHDRYENYTTSTYDLCWNRLPFVINSTAFPFLTDRPEKLNEMILIAEKLSHGIPFVRVDLYTVPRIYFGEMTFTPNAGFNRFDPPQWDRIIGDFFDMSWLSKGLKYDRN